MYRNVNTIDTFKEKLKNHLGYKTNYLYHQYPSKAIVNQTRLRLGLSGLASHRYKYNHINNPKCPKCDAKCEDLIHYFILCPAHTVHRDPFLREICQILNNNNIEVEFRSLRFRNKFIEIVLKGTQLLSDANNNKIFEITQNYIKNSQRFT